MSTTYSTESGAGGEASAYGGFVDALGGIATIVLAIIALSGTKADLLLPIATNVFGAALLIQGGAMLSEFAQTEATAEASARLSGGGLAGLFLVGVAGIVLGVLALLGVYPLVLTSAATIAFGGALVCGLAAADHAVGCRPLPRARLNAELPCFRRRGWLLGDPGDGRPGSDRARHSRGSGHGEPGPHARSVTGRGRRPCHDREHPERDDDRPDAIIPA